MAEFLATVDTRSTEKLIFSINSNSTTYTFGNAKSEPRGSGEKIDGNVCEHPVPIVSQKTKCEKANSNCNIEAVGPDVVAEFLATVETNNVVKLGIELFEGPMKLFSFGGAKNNSEQSDTKPEIGTTEQKTSTDKMERQPKNKQLAKETLPRETDWGVFLAPPAEEHHRPLNILASETGKMCAKSEPPHPSARVSRGCRSHDTSMSIQVIELSVQAEQGCYTNPIGRELEEGVITTESEKNPRKLGFEMTQEQTKYCFGVEKKYVEDEITVNKNKQDDCMHSRSAKLSATSAGAEQEQQRVLFVRGRGKLLQEVLKM